MDTATVTPEIPTEYAGWSETTPAQSAQPDIPAEYAGWSESGSKAVATTEPSTSHTGNRAVGAPIPDIPILEPALTEHPIKYVWEKATGSLIPESIQSTIEKAQTDEAAGRTMRNLDFSQSQRVISAVLGEERRHVLAEQREPSGHASAHPPPDRAAARTPPSWPPCKAPVCRAFLTAAPSSSFMTSRTCANSQRCGKTSSPMCRTN